MIMRKLWVILILLIFGAAALGCRHLARPTAPEEIKDAIRLKSRVFAPPRGLDRDFERYIKERAAEGRVHVLIQFDEVPGPADREEMKKNMGLTLLDPVPDRAFFASIPADTAALKPVIGKKGTRWVGRIIPRDKVAPWLLEKRIPEHARLKGGDVELIVEFFGDAGIAAQQQVLSRGLARILNRIEPLNGWRVVMAEKDILKLASSDHVKWIEETPPPPEEDNDGVRGTTGLNADPVLNPSPYNLTGNGVVMAQWEPTHSSLTHSDLAGRITLADPPLSPYERSAVHDESAAANGQYDNGEAVYIDMDDSGSVSAGDTRLTPVGAFAAGSVVSAGPPADPDIGTVLAFFNANERFADTATVNNLYSPGEGVYQDADWNWSVSAGDTRLTPVGAFAAGSVVSAGPPADADLGQALTYFRTNPHYHSTHVAGTAIGNGSQSLAQGGTPNQWKGVASGATIRSYSGNPTSTTGAPIPNDDYVDAANNGVSISTNSWGTSHCHQVLPPLTCYNTGSQYYDAVVSGRRSDNTPSGLARRVAIFGSAGNRGRPERHAENVAANGLYDNGEAVYVDSNDNGTVDAAVDQLVIGPVQPNATPLVNFNLNEMHDESVDTFGTLNANEGICLDADSSRTVSAGDTRILPAAGSAFAAGSVVAAGDADNGTFLRQFRLWGNIRIPNSAKDTVEVANITSDAATLSASSSRGPTDDGRLKPDISGPGSENGNDGGVKSTYPGNLYYVDFGTSMSTPAVAAGAAVIEQWYRATCSPGGPAPEVLKALIIHAAEDLTNIPNVAGMHSGPDFAFGFGRARIKEAVDLLPHHLQGTLNAAGAVDNYTVTIGTMGTLKATLVWDDPPWTANALPSPATGILQNDLDLILIAPDGTQYTPWVANGMDPFAPSSSSAVASGAPIPATALDRRNTVEQVVVANAMPGVWTIRVSASTMNLPSQGYTLVSEALPPNTAACNANPAADVWVRDNPADTGAVPSTGSMWLGPDIWNRLAPDGLTSHENPEFGQVNYLYANVRNASPTDVKATTMDVWAGSAALGLIWPDSFTYVGRFSIPNLTPGEVRQIGPLEWNPPSPNPSNHYCLYMRVASPQDPITFVETPSVWTNASSSNNIAYRNIIVVDLASSRSVTFQVRNVLDKEADIDVDFEIPKEFFNEGEVRMRLSPELEKAWPLKSRDKNAIVPEKGLHTAAPKMPSEEPIEEARPQATYLIKSTKASLKRLHMHPRQASTIILTFGSKRKTKAVYDVHVTERIGERTEGGILFKVRTGYAKER